MKINYKVTKFNRAMIYYLKCKNNLPTDTVKSKTSGRTWLPTIPKPLLTASFAKFEEHLRVINQ